MAREYARSHFQSKFHDVERLLDVFDHSRIDARHFCVPPEWFMAGKSFQEKNDTYIEQACKLSEHAIRNCLESADLDPRDIDRMIFVSTTGLATPSIDARLINILKMRSDIRRLPVWGLGCVGGAAGLSLARDYLQAFPRSKVLLVAVELCSLTFQSGDLGKSSFVATALFGDGAAAVQLSGEGVGPEILATRSTIWPDSLDVMGWNVLNEGMQVVFSRAIPTIVLKYANENISSFLKDNGLKINDVEYFLIHPRGARVIDAYIKALSIDSGKLRIAAEILREYGNMSSVTILYILDQFLKSDDKRPGAYGIMTALGPGFSSELLLFKT
jgi:alkylresorcinol/alkylpyrone synthase